MAVRTLKDGQSRLEYSMSSNNFTSKPDKPGKKNVRPINIALPKACHCPALKPRRKALILLQDTSKDLKKLNLNGDSVVFSRKAVPANLLRDALKKCPTTYGTSNDRERGGGGFGSADP